MNVAVFFGGRSCEHSISIITGVQAMKEIDRRHTLIPVYIDEEGSFFYSKEYPKSVYAATNKRTKRVAVHLRANSPYLYTNMGRRLARIDCALLCNHGAGGEDGSLQGYLQMCGIAYSGSSLRASAVGMDKIMMKKVFMANSLPILPCLALEEGERRNMDGLIERIESEIGYPVIIKPSNLGSSIGISIASDKSQLIKSLDTAFEWDNRVLAERALQDFTELNCAVFGNSYGVKKVTEIEKPVGWKQFLTFEDKYVKKSKGSGRVFPADIDEATRQEVQRLAGAAFEALGCSGVARVDFLLKGSELYINEINTIPGALSNYLFSYNNDISFTSLIDMMIEAALIEKAKNDRLKHVYKSSFSIQGKH